MNRNDGLTGFVLFHRFALEAKTREGWGMEVQTADAKTKDDHPTHEACLWKPRTLPWWDTVSQASEARSGVPGSCDYFAAVFWGDSRERRMAAAMAVTAPAVCIQVRRSPSSSTARTTVSKG